MIIFRAKKKEMIRPYLNDLLRTKGAEHPQAYLIGLGFTAREARTLIHGDKVEQMRDSMLQRICEHLLCTPNDVFRWYGPKDHLLMALNRSSASRVADVMKQAKSAAESKRMLEKALEALAEEEPQLKMHGGRLFLNVERLLRQRQVKKMNRELVRMGFTAMEAQRLLSPERVAFKMKMLKRLCEAFRCLPNELFDFEGPEGHVLNAVRKEEMPMLDERLKGLTEEQVRRVVEAMGKNLR